RKTGIGLQWCGDCELWRSRPTAGWVVEAAGQGGRVPRGGVRGGWDETFPLRSRRGPGDLRDTERPLRLPRGESGAQRGARCRAEGILPIEMGRRSLWPVAPAESDLRGRGAGFDRGGPLRAGGSGAVEDPA